MAMKTWFPSSNPIPVLIFFSLFLAAALCCGCEKKNHNVEASPVLVEVITAVKEDREITQRYSGYAYPYDASGVGFLIAGRVASLPVKEGDLVRKGQLIATLVPDDYRLVERLAETQLGAIAPNYERVDTLVKKEALAQSKLDEVKARYDAARTQKEQAERQVNYTKLLAPVDGVVHELRTAVGQVIGAGMPAVVLLDINRMKVKFGIPQVDLKHFKVGDKTRLSFPGVEGEREGKITFVSYVPDEISRSYFVTVEVANADKSLRPGLLAHMILVKDRLSGIFVPLHAIVHNADGQTSLLLVGQDERAAAAPVTLGRRLGEDMEVVSGLSGGERVIVKGQTYARQGDRVTVR